MKYFSFIDLALVAVVGFYLYLSPFTKVEESFNIQAIHDIVNYGVFQPDQLQYYDHQQFPGVVPRTFIGSVLIGGIIKAIDFVYKLSTGTSFTEGADGTQLQVQVLARAILGFFNILGLITLKNAITTVVERSKKQKGSWIGFNFIFLTVVQFHINYYSTRTLPNFLALPLVNFALSKIIKGDMSGLTWLGLVGVVFRLEVGVLGAIIAVVSSLGFGQSPVHINIFLLAVGSVAGIIWSVGVDSYFWGRWIWPEFEAFKYNIISGNSINWGVESYGAYFFKYLPALFRPPHVILLALLGLFTDPADDGTPVVVTDDNKVVVRHPSRNSLRVLTISAVLYLLVISKQPHKEWRFIIYVVPILTLLAANALRNLGKKWKTLFSHRLLLFVMLGSTLVSFPASLFMTFASSYNYPGGVAVNYLNNYLLDHKSLSDALVHLDVPACMSGVTRFTELKLSSVSYDKTENPRDLNLVWNNITHLITHVDMDSEVPQTEFIAYNSQNWKKLHLVKTFKAVNFDPVVKVLEHSYKENSLPEYLLPQKVTTGKEYLGLIYDFLKTLISTNDFIYIYERLHPDSIPILLKADTSDEHVRAEEEVLAGKAEEQPPKVDEDAFQDALNEQIDIAEGEETRL